METGRPIARPGPLLLAAMALGMLLAGCGGGSSGGASLPPGRDVDVPGFETYVNDHDGFSRVRRDDSRPEDAPVIAGFEDNDPRDPAGYRNLIALNREIYGGRVVLEALAEVEQGEEGERAVRLLRLTADTEPFRNGGDGRVATASGQFYLRGHNVAWVSIDDGPLLSGEDSRGLVNMVVDFDTETASLELRTGVHGASQVRTEVNAENLPFNIRTGAYGGEIAIRAWDPDSPDILETGGSLRGNLGGTPGYANDRHGLSTAGLYIGEGEDAATGRQIRVVGAYTGVDPNALP